MKEEGFTLWFTGLSGAGKTTLAEKVAEAFKQRNLLRFQVLDGDQLRAIYNDLTFSKEDRIKKYQAGSMDCTAFKRTRSACFSSFITPYQEMRDYCRKHLKRYIEVYIKCPLEICIHRDVKGLYKRALNGEIQNFTGISDPFEEPKSPDLTIYTAKEKP